MQIFAKKIIVYKFIKMQRLCKLLLTFRQPLLLSLERKKGHR